MSYCLKLFLCLMLLGLYSPLAHTGAAASELKECMSAHYRAFWKLREWAREEQLQLFQLTEKAFFVRVFLMASSSLLVDALCP